MHNHWTKKYLSQKFIPFGCGEFSALVLNKEFGLDIKSPKSTLDLRKDPELIESFLDVKFTETKEPKDGDIVLMDGDRIACHVGIFAIVSNKKCVIHADRRFKSACLHEIDKLILYGYKANRYYTWRK